MTRLNLNTRGAERQRGCLFAESFDSQTHVESNMGVVTSAPVFDSIGGVTLDGTDDKITYNLTSYTAIKSVSFWVLLSTTTEDLIKLSATHSITVSGGTISATGFTSPVIIVDDTATSTIAADGWHFVTCRTATAFSVDDFVVGEVAGFGAFTMRDLKLWDAELTLAENADYYNETTWTWRERATIYYPMLNADHVAGSHTINRGTLGSAGNAAFGGTPTKTAYRRGYTFDGTSDFLSIPVAAHPGTTGSMVFSSMGMDLDNNAKNRVFGWDASSGYNTRCYHAAGNVRVQWAYTDGTYELPDLHTFEHSSNESWTGAIAWELTGGTTTIKTYTNGVKGDEQSGAKTTQVPDVSFTVGEWNGSFFEGDLLWFYAFDFEVTNLQALDIHRTMMREINEE